MGATPSAGASVEELRREIIRLGPWHLDVEVAPGLSTRAWLEAGGTYPESFGDIAFLDQRDDFKRRLAAIYPAGLEGRSFLDCACNCGGYVFWAREAGAGECFGFDVREHWIRQAEFLLKHRPEPKDGLQFEVADLYDLPKLDLQPFDVTLFKGILYHLPDPVAGMRIAADLTREVMIVNTGTAAGLPDGALVVDNERTEPLMSGVHGLNWYPTGPEVVVKILRWLGFRETRLMWWRPETRPGRGRLELVASKREGVLAGLPDLSPEDAKRVSGPSGNNR